MRGEIIKVVRGEMIKTTEEARKRKNAETPLAWTPPPPTPTPLSPHPAKDRTLTADLGEGAAVLASPFPEKLATRGDCTRVTYRFDVSLSGFLLVLARQGKCAISVQNADTTDLLRHWVLSLRFVSKYFSRFTTNPLSDR